MQLTTEELQYLEISFWKDYNEKLIVKRDDKKIKKELEKMSKSLDMILKQTPKIRMT